MSPLPDKSKPVSFGIGMLAHSFGFFFSLFDVDLSIGQAQLIKLL